jgi:hypothetical protein
MLSFPARWVKRGDRLSRIRGDKMGFRERCPVLEELVAEVQELLLDI